MLKNVKEQKSLTGMNELVCLEVIRENGMEKMRNEETAEGMMRQWDFSEYVCVVWLSKPDPRNVCRHHPIY